MDDIDRHIVTLLYKDSRMPLKALADQIGLSSPSTSERLRRLEERGIIQTYTVEINPQALGYQLQAIIRIRPLPGQSRAVQKLIEETPEFCECDKVTGDDCYIVRLFVTSVEQLDTVVERIAIKAETNTVLVKSQPIKRRLPPLL